MKKTNKKGFTLAELLIVIAIIAVLIAIAIPTFSGALRNARLQTDHANIRSAYAMAMTANMMGGVDYNGTFVASPTTGTKTYYFNKDGSLTDGAHTNAYELQVDANNASPAAECAASIGCQKATTTNHKKGYVIKITYNASDTNPEWKLELGAKS